LRQLQDLLAMSATNIKKEEIKKEHNTKRPREIVDLT